MTRTELKEALKRKQAYVMVAGTETWVQITHREAEHLRKALKGALVVDGDDATHAAYVEARRAAW